MTDNKDALSAEAKDLVDYFLVCQSQAEGIDLERSKRIQELIRATAPSPAVDVSPTRYAVTDNGDYEWIIDEATGNEVPPDTICRILNGQAIPNRPAMREAPEEVTVEEFAKRFVTNSDRFKNDTEKLYALAFWRAHAGMISKDFPHGLRIIEPPKGEKS